MYPKKNFMGGLFEFLFNVFLSAPRNWPRKLMRIRTEQDELELVAVKKITMFLSLLYFPSSQTENTDVGQENKSCAGYKRIAQI